MVTGEHAQAARVDRHRIVHAELGAEVRDRLAAKLRKRAGIPRVLVGALGREPLQRTIIAGAEGRVAREGDETIGVDLLQQRDRVVPETLPERLVDLAKERAGIAIPAPGQIVGQMREPDEACRERCRT